VLVSTGGGAVAGPMIDAVLGARPLTRLKTRTWRILAGHNLPEAAFRAYRKQAGDGVTLERARPDFLDLLARAELSISQAGYNTVMEILAAGPPAVVVPFAGGAETEQSLRADLLAERGLLTVVEEAGLDGPALAEGIDRALARRGTARPSVALVTDGAARTADMLARMLAIVAP
jgi:predicted glycosyltransferase